METFWVVGETCLLELVSPTRKEPEAAHKNGRLFLLTGLTNKRAKRSGKSLEHIELAAKLLYYFLRSNKSNINQTWVLNWDLTMQLVQ